MNLTPNQKANHLFNEIIQWITDYLENEIDFDVLETHYEDKTKALQYDDFDLLLELSQEQTQLLSDLDELMDQRILTLYEPDIVDPISESEFKSQLLKLLNEEKKEGITHA